MLAAKLVVVALQSCRSLAGDFGQQRNASVLIDWSESGKLAEGCIHSESPVDLAVALLSAAM